MAEIKTPIDEWKELDGSMTYKIRNRHSIADIARWLIDKNMDTDIMYFLNNRDTL